MAQANKFGKQGVKQNNKTVFLHRRKPGKPSKPIAAFYTVEEAQKAQEKYEYETIIINEKGSIV